MPLVVFEPTILAFERAKTVHALDRAATVISRKYAQANKLARDMKQRSATCYALQLIC
jgi:hypothetical protein